MTTTIHMSVDVRGVLEWPKRLFNNFSKGALHPDGRAMTPQEFRDRLYDELAKGHEVVPIGEPCEGFDFSGKGCPGHPSTKTSSNAAE